MSEAGEFSKRTDAVLTRADLISELESGCKPKTDWRIGTEHEKIPFNTADHSLVPYDGPAGIRALLEGLAADFGWQPVMEGQAIIGLKKDGCNVSLEPGGQFELSGAPLETLHQTCNEVHTHLHEVRTVGERLGLAMLGMGFNPVSKLDDVPVMPKGRYKIMRAYMPKVGGHGRDMMFRSCTVQVNLDFGSEADMVKKFRTSLALQPVATALFANSPFVEGKPSGYQSFRARVWQDVDPHRTGNLPFVFEEGFGFERYVDYALDVPMYFLYRDGVYNDVTGLSFRDLIDGKLPGFEGEIATQADWANHLTTLFPDVRIKQFMEMRGADAGPWRQLCALPAFWTGLLYDDAALEAASSLVSGWSDEDRLSLMMTVPEQGFAATVAGRSVLDVACDAVAIAADGLKARGLTDSKGNDESQYIAPLQEIVTSGRTMAEDLLAKFDGEWNGDVTPIYTERAY